jgi:glycosyltransferase involved in cell wall biosynthesis
MAGFDAIGAQREALPDAPPRNGGGLGAVESPWTAAGGRPPIRSRRNRRDRPRVALVHDYLLVRRGAERTFEAITECWPDAPIFTLLYDEEGTEGRFAHREIHTSYLQRIGCGQAGFRKLLPTFPRAVRSLRLRDYDLVISSSSAFAHGVRVPTEGRHVCYCHSPFRYAWFERERALEEVAPMLRPLLRRTLEAIRRADLRASRSVHSYLANSTITQSRISEFWDRPSTVIHPPVEVERFSPAPPERYFLVVTELVRHKRVELALEAARRAKVEIRVVGDGPDKERLESSFGGPGGTARFLGRLCDGDLERQYARAQALVLPNVEEFGIAAVEAQASGRPVVAVAEGGALETVVHGKTGVLVSRGDVDGLASALESTSFEHFDPARIVAHANAFSKNAFQRRISEAVGVAAESAPLAQTGVPAASAAL